MKLQHYFIWSPIKSNSLTCIIINNIFFDQYLIPQDTENIFSRYETSSMFFFFIKLKGLQQSYKDVKISISAFAILRSTL
jgi:hypothetical protein